MGILRIRTKGVAFIPGNTDRAPLRGLTAHISAIRTHGGPRLRLRSKRRDEMGMLAHEFDVIAVTARE